MKSFTNMAPFFVTLMIMLLATFARAHSFTSSGAMNQRIKNGQVTEVTSLPGWPSDKPLPTKTFSGYFDLEDAKLPEQDKMLMHYVLYQSENDVENDPVIIWYNGGPGATSVWGLFVENGPMLLNAESLVGMNASSGAATLIENPYAWTKFATVVAFANPPPVGFSYCTPPGPTGNGTACGTWNDTRVGVANAEAIEILFNDHFPQLLFNKPEKKLFIIGESYAGVYIGETGMAMLAKPTRFSKILNHLDGIGLGDACLGSDVLCGSGGAWYHLYFLYGHAQFPTTAFNKLLAVCGGEEALKKKGPYHPACEAEIKNIYTMVGGYFAYNIYDQCPHNAFMTVSADGKTGAVPKRLSQAHEHKQAHQMMSRRHILDHHHKNGGGAVLSPKFKNTALKRALEAQVDGGAASSAFVGVQQGSGGSKSGQVPLDNGYWCPEQVFFNYMDRDDVRAALNVPKDSNFFNADDGVGMKYVYNCKTVMPFIESLIKNTTGVIKKPVKVVAYDGDADPSVNIFITQDVWYGFGKQQFNTESKAWSPWTFGENIVAGYNTQWGNGLLQFTSIRGSGHMVPEFKPLSAQVFVEAFVTDAPLPAWAPNGPPSGSTGKFSELP